MKTKSQEKTLTIIYNVISHFLSAICGKQSAAVSTVTLICSIHSQTAHKTKTAQIQQPVSVHQLIFRCL